MPDQAQSDLEEPAPAVRPSVDPPFPSYSGTHTLEHMHTKPEWEKKPRDRMAAAIQIDMKLFFNQKQHHSDASQVTLACHI